MAVVALLALLAVCGVIFSRVSLQRGWCTHGHALGLAFVLALVCGVGLWCVAGGGMGAGSVGVGELVHGAAGVWGLVCEEGGVQVQSVGVVGVGGSVVAGAGMAG